MNAVMTAEYVVIVELKLSEIQEKISEHAAQGFRLASLETNPETSFETGSYTAVMVREPHTNSQTLIMILQNNILQLQSQVARLEEQVEENEAKIDWSK